MEIVKLTQAQLDEILTPDAQATSSGNFETLANGKPAQKRTPFHKDKSESQVFSEWFKTLDKYEQVPEYKALVEYDKSRMSKVGPQGGFVPFDERKSVFEEYYTLPDQSDFAIDLDICAEITRELFGNQRDKRPISFENVLKRDIREDKLDTNSGCPDFGKKSNPVIQANAIKDAKSGKWKIYPAIVFGRSQRGKQRDVLGMAFSAVLVEKSFMYPLLDIVRSRGIPFFSAWEGFRQVELGFEEVDFFYDSDILVQQDYTSMDKTINKTHSKIFFLICAPIFQAKYRPQLQEILDHMFSVPFMISLDKVYTGIHGMPSGSAFTNFFESIISYYVWKLNDKRSNIANFRAAQGLGDDMAFSLKLKQNPLDLLSLSNGIGIDLDELISQIGQDLSDSSASIGLIVQPFKNLIDPYTTVYLQRFFDLRMSNDEGIVLGMYPSILAINTAMNPERMHDPRKWSGNMEILRWIMILENCKNLPYFIDLVRFFIEGDKYKMGLVLPGFFAKLPQLYEESKAIKGFVPSYNQESMDRGIYEFETVKLLIKLRGELN